MSNIENPFLVYGYEGPEYFCDREEETRIVSDALRNGCNITLMSPRRYGKTGLIHNVFYKMEREQPDVRCFYVDIYSTKCLADFVKLLGRSVIGKLDTPIQKAEGFIHRFFHSTQLTLGLDPMTNLPQVGLSFQPQQTENTLEEIFAYIAQAEMQCYIAIDEFQEVADYPENNFEELFRTFVQQTHNVHFIFSGSRLHVMSAMFSSPQHPFYRSTERLHLDVLPKDVYYRFAVAKLSEKGITMSEEMFDFIYKITDGVTWYVQSILNKIYRSEGVTIDEVMIERSVWSIILSEEEDFKQMFRLLTAGQLQLLKALASEKVVREPMSGAFLRKYGLKAPSSVQRTLNFLVEHEYVYQSDEGYLVYDRFMGIWIRRRLGVSKPLQSKK